MNLWKRLKEPIHQSDLMPVIRQGIFMSFTGGLLIGAMHLLFTFLFNFSLTWLMLFVLAHLIARRIKNAYIEYHVIYSIISIIFFIIAYYIMSLTLYGGLFYINNIIDPKLYLMLLNPIQYFIFLNPLTTYFLTVENLIEVIFFIIGTLYAYRYSK